MWQGLVVSMRSHSTGLKGVRFNKYGTCSSVSTRIFVIYRMLPSAATELLSRPQVPPELKVNLHTKLAGRNYRMSVASHGASAAPFCRTFWRRMRRVGWPSSRSAASPCASSSPLCPSVLRDQWAHEGSPAHLPAGGHLPPWPAT